MSKYDPLFQHLNAAHGVVDLVFGDIEKILGFSLPPSARRYPAWWSNSGGTHIQSQAWQAAGYKTEAVDLAGQTVRFVPEQSGFSEMKQEKLDKSKLKEPQFAKSAQHPAYGALKGLITILPGVDITQPAYEDWKKLYGEE